MSSTNTIGVVTVTYNSVPVLDQFLESLSAQSHSNFVLYAIDNASKDGTVARLEAWGDARLRVIANAVNVGVAEGNNQGTRAALADECSVVLYMNNDIEFAPETFATLLAEMDRLQCDMITPKILTGDGIHIWAAGGGFKPAKGYLSFHLGEGELDRAQHDSPKAVQHGPTCCLMVRPSVFAAVGLMDKRYFVYHDDSDFNFRAWRHGCTLFYTPVVTILHKVSSLTGGASSDFTVRYNTRGHVYFMLKNLALVQCLYLIPALQLRIIYKVLARKISWHGYKVRQMAFFEGLKVWFDNVTKGPMEPVDARGFPA